MKPPQLRMIHRLRVLPDPPALAPGYTYRQAADADAEQIDRLLGAAFGPEWPENGARTVLLDHPEVPTTWVVLHEESVVATASYQLKPVEFPESALVHYVGADPAHSGKGLGLFVSWKVLHQAADAGRKAVFLTTDDERLPAIRTYLKLGFEPECWHESHAERWRAVMDKFAKSKPKAAPSSPERCD